MKKIVTLASALVTATVMLCGAAPASADNDRPLESYRYYVTGDVNNDGEVSVEDAMLILRHATETIAGITGCLNGSSAYWTFAADMNYDNQITVEDALFDLQYYVENSVAQNTLAWTEMLVGDLLHSEELITDLDVIAELLEAFCREQGFVISAYVPPTGDRVALCSIDWRDWENPSLYGVFQDFISANNIDETLLEYTGILE